MVKSNSGRESEVITAICLPVSIFPFSSPKELTLARENGNTTHWEAPGKSQGLGY